MSSTVPGDKWREDYYYLLRYSKSVLLPVMARYTDRSCVRQADESINAVGNWGIQFHHVSIRNWSRHVVRLHLKQDNCCGNIFVSIIKTKTSGVNVLQCNWTTIQQNMMNNMMMNNNSRN